MLPFQALSQGFIDAEQALELGEAALGPGDSSTDPEGPGAVLGCPTARDDDG